MKSLLICATAVTAVILLSTSLVRTQTFPFQKYTPADGLGSAVVRKVFQDSRGLLWFGTEKGANSYDGRTFTEYLKSGLDPYPVYEIFEDRRGVLWLGTYGFGLIRLHPGMNAQSRRSIADSILQHYVTAIIEDTHGTIWVGSDNGLFAVRSDGEIIHVSGLDGVGEIYALVVDSSGTIWIGSHRGLFAAQTANPNVMKFRQILQKPTRSLLLRRNGDILAGTDGGGNDQYGMVYRITGGTADTLLSYATAKSLIKAQSLFEDSDGALWIGTGYGVFVMNDGKITHIQTRNGLQNENIYDIMQDREGTMWFGTENGAIKLARPIVVNYGMDAGLTGYTVLSELRDRDGNLWFGMWNGLNRIDHNGSVTTWDQTRGLPHHTIRSMAEDAAGSIIVGTPRGLALVNGKHASRLHLRGVPENLDVWSVYCEPDSTLWVGGGGKLFRTKHGVCDREISMGAGIPGGAVEVQCRDRQGRLWVLAGSRATTVVGDGEVVYRPDQGDSFRRRIHSIHMDKNGTLWFCTSTGIMILNDDVLRPPVLLDSSLTQNPVYCMIETAGTVWFGTDHGVRAWGGKRVSLLTSADGLASDIVNVACVGLDGSIWFGTHGGVSVIDPSSAAYLSPVPAVYLDPVLAGDGADPTPDEGTIPYEDRTIVFKFNALSYVAEREMIFQWMVEGFDRDWREPRMERQVRYTNLGPGAYIFKVRASNRNGRWSEPANFHFAIQPPFWRTWWFISFCILMVASVLTFAYQYRVNQLLTLERMRRRIAADLHDDIASSLSSVGIYATVIQRQLQGVPAEVRTLLDRIRELSRESMENIGLIVWSVDPRRDELTEVFCYFQRYGEDLCKAAGVEFSAKLPEVVSSTLLTPELRRTLFLILKEALNNALRHSRATRIQFAGSIDGHILGLELTDNGCGFSTVSGDGHGLHNMRARGESIGALVTVNSKPERGTSVSLRVRIA